MGYKNPVITLTFPDLTDDPEGDPIRVVIRNPKLMPGDEIKSMAVGTDDEGADGGETMNRMFAMIARLVVGWRVYDPTTPVKVNEHTGELIWDEETKPRLLPLPATPELVAKLPQVISLSLMNEVSGAIHPQESPAETTSTTS